MTLSQSRSSFAERMQEVRSVHAHIGVLEEDLGRSEPSVGLLSLRGLFFVHLYGVFENSVNSAVQEFLRSIRAGQVRCAHLARGAYVYSLDGGFDSISSLQGKKGFSKRVEFIEGQFADRAVDVADTIFSMSLQNIGAADYENVFKWLDLSVSAFPPQLLPKRGYLDEIVEKRRKVSHGREAASIVGQGTRAPDLTLRISAVNECVEHLFQALEVHLEGKNFIAEAYRAAYA